MARRSLQLSHAVQEARLRGRGGADAGAGHRGQHRDLHDLRTGPVAVVARQGPGGPGPHRPRGQVHRLPLGRQPRSPIPCSRISRRRRICSKGSCAGGARRRVDDGRGAERMEIELASASYFDVLGVPPALGRTFVAEDEAVSGGDPVVVLSHEFWRTRFRRGPVRPRPDAAHQWCPAVVVGVAPAGFNGVSLDARPRLFLPVTMKKRITPSWRPLDDRKNAWVQVFARLPKGVSHEQATEALQARHRQIIERRSRAPDSRIRRWRTASSSSNRGRCCCRRARASRICPPSLGPTLRLLMGLAALVLLAACASVSNLLIARATSRQKETTVRLAIGAGRWRIFRQVLVESLLLATAGGLAALAVALGTTHAILLFAPGQLKSAVSPSLNGQMLVFGLVISMAAALLSACFRPGGAREWIWCAPSRSGQAPCSAARAIAPAARRWSQCRWACRWCC